MFLKSQYWVWNNIKQKRRPTPCPGGLYLSTTDIGNGLTNPIQGWLSYHHGFGLLQELFQLYEESWDQEKTGILKRWMLNTFCTTHSQSCLGKEGFLTVWEVAVSALHGMCVTCIYSSTNANWNWSSDSFLLLRSEIKAQDSREFIVWIRSSLRTVPRLETQ